MNRYNLVATGLATLLLGGCAMHGARVRSVNLSESGTYVVATPGALTIARQSGGSSRTCTLRTGAPGKGKHGHHLDGSHKSGGAPGPHAGGATATLDVLLFRLCEARANNDMSAAQYAGSVQAIIKTMSDMAERRPPPPGAGMGHWNPPAARWFEQWQKHEHGDHERGDHDGKREHHEAGPQAHPGPQGGPPHAPPRKGNERHKHH